MIIAVASGKGGTGKTTISVALAQAYGKDITFLDCDVEEPNANIFLKALNTVSEDVNIKIPVIDTDKCTLCGECSNVCEFNAIAVLTKEAMIFDELCHSCGGCILACPSNAIYEKESAIGKLTGGKSGNISFYEGKIDVGRALVPPIIRAVKKKSDINGITIIDSPPGTACPAVTAMNGSNYIVLVTEATPFGLNDLKLAVDVVRQLDIPYGVIINRCDTGDVGVEEYCKKEEIDILLMIPENIEIAKAYSRGESIINVLLEIKDVLNDVLSTIIRSAK